MLWQAAIEEFEGPSRRTGLYAKALAVANGDDSRAKAFYLKARVDELQRGERYAAVSSTFGACPNCDRTLPIAAERCNACDATFTSPEGWKLKPLSA